MIRAVDLFEKVMLAESRGTSEDYWERRHRGDKNLKVRAVMICLVQSPAEIGSNFCRFFLFSMTDDFSCFEFQFRSLKEIVLFFFFFFFLDFS